MDRFNLFIMVHFASQPKTTFSLINYHRKLDEHPFSVNNLKLALIISNLNANTQK